MRSAFSKKASKQKWVIAIALLIDRKRDCHTLKTYAYPVIQQGRKRVGIANNLPSSLFFRRKKEEGRGKKEEGRGKKEEGRRKREEGRRKKEEGRRKREEGRMARHGFG
jgi:hypothetical protein